MSWLARVALEVASGRRDRWATERVLGPLLVPPVCLRLDGEWSLYRLWKHERSSLVLFRHESGEIASMVVVHDERFGELWLRVIPPAGVRLTGLRPFSSYCGSLRFTA